MSGAGAVLSKVEVCQASFRLLDHTISDSLQCLRSNAFPAAIFSWPPPGLSWTACSVCGTSSTSTVCLNFMDLLSRIRVNTQLMLGKDFFDSTFQRLNLRLMTEMIVADIVEKLATLR